MSLPDMLQELGHYKDLPVTGTLDVHPMVKCMWFINYVALDCNIQTLSQIWCLLHSISVFIATMFIPSTILNLSSISISFQHLIADAVVFVQSC